MKILQAFWAILKKIFNYILVFLGWLVNPLFTWEDIAEKRQVQMLATISLSFGLLNAIGIMATVSASGFSISSLVLLILTGLTLLTYALSRTKLHYFGALIFIWTWWIGAYITTATTSGNAVGTLNSLLAYVFIMASALLGIRAIFILVVTSFFSFFVMGSFIPGISTTEILTVVGTSGTVAVLVLIFTAFRNYQENSRLQELKKTNEELRRVNQEISAYRQSLETRVEERTLVLEQRSQELITRTLELETANLQAERRNEQLIAIAAVSNAIAMLHNLDDMLPKITELISEKFGFYHVAIFLNDPTATLSMLKACNSAGGKNMLERGYNLKIDKTSIVGIVASTGRPYIALDSGNEFALPATPDLPETRSELAVPLKFAGKTIGVLDVQSSQPNAFSPDDTQVLATLADQVSLAIQNAEFFENAQKSAAETQKLLRQYAREQWARITKVQKKIGYIYKGDFKPLDQKVLENSGQNPNRQIIPVPIMVRGQMIGTLAISAPKERNFSADEIDIIRAAAERTAIAAENARLLEDSQNRVIKEQTISSITSKIGASVNLHNILQTAVEEIGRIIPGSEVAIEIEKKAEE